MSGTIIELRRICQCYDRKKVVDIPFLSIHRGEILVVLGPNGAGKSTLMRIIGLVERPEEGEIVWEGLRVKNPTSRLDIRRKISMVLQKPFLFDMKVKENIAYGLRIRKMKSSRVDEKVGEMMALFGISHLQERDSAMLSGGEEHRVSLARALAVEPELLLLDEPFSSLDMPSRESLREEIKHIIKRTTTSIYVTHDRTEALVMADRILVMDNGTILQDGRPEEVFNRPISKEVAHFVGVENILPGVIAACESGVARINVQGATMEAVSETPVSGNVWVCIRPEEVLICRSVSGIPTKATTTLRARITRIMNHGSIHKVHLDVGFCIVSFVMKQLSEQLQLTVNDEVFAVIEAKSVHLIEQRRNETI